MEERKKTQGLIYKKNDFENWYPELILKTEIADYSAVSGCLVIRPYGYAIWEKVVKVIDENLKKMGIKNAYFPLLIPESFLKKEEEHVKGFSPEVAWVTETGDTKLNERLAVRPTSETIIYPSYSKWIKSYTDLPIKLNLWNNVLRWEFKHPKPFLRGREFLWNEGHTAFATKEEAEKEVKEVLDMYYDFVEDYMALASQKSKKTDSEKFAGAVYTTSVECMLPDGKMAQGPDAHFDGQNFARAFDIKFIDKDGEIKYVWQNTFAISTRMLGLMFAMHSDDKGLVIPPKLAPTQIVIVPIYTDKEKKKVLAEAKKISKSISKNYSIELDNRENYTPGWKFHEWEMKGVPLRIEIGPRDIKNKSVVVARRDTGEKINVKIKELSKILEKEIYNLNKRLYEKSKNFLDYHTKIANSFEELKRNIDGNRVLINWCGNAECETKIKEETGAKSTGIPFDVETKGNCAICGKKAKHTVYFAKTI
jgi:prolyl-tRNA synthetase